MRGVFKLMSFRDWLSEQEVTSNVFESIFIFPNGLMISGEFYMGDRGLDHNVILGLAPKHLTHTQAWNYVHNTFGVVRVVPETKTALILQGQYLTDIQRELIIRTGFRVEGY